MTQPPDVQERYVAAFKAFATNGAGAAPPWLREIREGAIARFTELGFPTMKQEEWRFTSVAPIAETRFALAQPNLSRTPTPRDIDRFVPRAVGRRRLVFVNGRHVPALSGADGLPAGVTALGLAEACRHPRGQELVRRHLGRYAGDARNAFTALNTAFLDDGAFMHVAPDTEMAEPLHLVFVTVPPASPALPPRPEPLVSHPRNIVIVERGARAAVVESYVALAEGVYWTNAVTELVVGEGARLEYCRVQRESRDAFHVAATHTQEGLRDELPGGWLLLAAAEGARRDVLEADFLPLYRTIELRPDVPDADVALLMSGSAARALSATGARLPVVAIGPRTAAEARAAGLEVIAVATTHDLEGLVEALRSSSWSSPS